MVPHGTPRVVPDLAAALLSVKAGEPDDSSIGAIDSCTENGRSKRPRYSIPGPLSRQCPEAGQRRPPRSDQGAGGWSVGSEIPGRETHENATPRVEGIDRGVACLSLRGCSEN